MQVIKIKDSDEFIFAAAQPNERPGRIVHDVQSIKKAKLDTKKYRDSVKEDIPQENISLQSGLMSEGRKKTVKSVESINSLKKT